MISIDPTVKGHFWLKYMYLSQKGYSTFDHHYNNDRLTAFDPGQPG